MKISIMAIGLSMCVGVLVSGCGEERQSPERDPLRREVDTRTAPGTSAGAPAHGEGDDPHAGLGIPPAFAVDNPGAAPAAAADGSINGRVGETMNSGGYTYLRVEAANGPVWVAVSQMTVAVGDRVQVAPGSIMRGFHSSTLDRTFEEIVFSPGAQIVPAGGGAAGGGAASGGAPGAGEAARPSAPGLPPGHPAVDRPAEPQG